MGTIRLRTFAIEALFTKIIWEKVAFCRTLLAWDANSNKIIFLTRRQKSCNSGAEIRPKLLIWKVVYILTTYLFLYLFFYYIYLLSGLSSPLASLTAINAIVFGVHGSVCREFSQPESLKAHFIAGCAAGMMQSIIGLC